jgi:hypothetical protein
MDTVAKAIGLLLFLALMIAIGISSSKESTKNEQWCAERGLSHRWVRGLNTVCIDAEGNMKIPPG